jgi:uncharacterized membrane protein
VLFGVGTCLKLYPALFVLPLACDRLLRGDRAGAVRVCLAAAATTLAVNLPFALADRRGWATTYAFQAAREADSSSNSLWYWIAPPLPAEQLNRWVPALVLLALAAALAHGVLRARRDGAYPFVQVCGAALVAFLLVNKVASPQYTLWLLPFLVLLRVHAGWWIAWTVADLMVYVGVFRWFDALVTGADPTLPARVLETGVWVRCALLVLLYPTFLRAATALRPHPTQRPDVKVSTSSAMTGADRPT